jgi:hypothetical protein
VRAKGPRPAAAGGTRSGVPTDCNEHGIAVSLHVRRSAVVLGIVHLIRDGGLAAYSRDGVDGVRRRSRDDARCLRPMGYTGGVLLE